MVVAGGGHAGSKALISTGHSPGASEMPARGRGDGDGGGRRDGQLELLLDEPAIDDCRIAIVDC